MYQPPIVNFPVFSVAWVEATDEQGITTPAVLTAGGGGAGNTGVGNKIVSFLRLLFQTVVCIMRATHHSVICLFYSSTLEESGAGGTLRREPMHLVNGRVRRLFFWLKAHSRNEMFVVSSSSKVSPAFGTELYDGHVGWISIFHAKLVRVDV